jgi:hypothetical protein
MIKSKIMIWVGHIAHRERGEACIGLWWVNVRERDHWGNPDVDGRIIIRWIFR